MRLIVAGAGGRMGRTLVKAIADAKGFALAGALEDARSPLIGWDAGTLAGTPENGVKLTGDAAALIGKADAIVDFTASVATVAFAELAAKSGKICIVSRLCSQLHELQLRRGAEEFVADPGARRAEIVVGVDSGLVELGFSGIDDDELHPGRKQLARDLHDRRRLRRRDDLGHEYPS